MNEKLDSFELVDSPLDVTQYISILDPSLERGTPDNDNKNTYPDWYNNLSYGAKCIIEDAKLSGHDLFFITEFVDDCIDIIIDACTNFFNKSCLLPVDLAAGNYLFEKIVKMLVPKIDLLKSKLVVITYKSEHESMDVVQIVLGIKDNQKKCFLLPTPLGSRPQVENIIEKK